MKKNSKQTKIFPCEFWSANLISSWHDFTLTRHETLRPVLPGAPLRPRHRCIAHFHNHSGAHADTSVAGMGTYVLHVPLLISASVPLAVWSSSGRTVWRAEAGWSCPLRSPSLSGSKTFGVKHHYAHSRRSRPALIDPSWHRRGQWNGEKKTKLLPPLLIRPKSDLCRLCCRKQLF